MPPSMSLMSHKIVIHNTLEDAWTYVHHHKCIALLSLDCYNQAPYIDWVSYKRQTFILDGSGGWEVR